MAGNKMDFSPDSYLAKLYQNNQPELQFDAENRAGWKKWRQKLKAKIADLIGGPLEKTQITELVVIEKREFETYSRVKIAYQVKDYLKIPAYLLIPDRDQDKYPAVIIAHGHGNGNRETLGLNGAGEKLEEATCHNNLALDFVEAGYIVLVPELIGFGERRLKEDYQEDPALKEDPTANSCYRINSQLMLYGQSILRLRLWDIISALKVLENREDVIREQISCLGFSGGAPVAILASLFSEGIKAAVISGYTSYYQDSIMDRRHCLDNYLPGILNTAELPTIISSIAPKPLLIQAAENDHLFPVDSAQKAYREIEKVYKFLNVEDRIRMDIIENAEHSVSAAAAIKFLNNLDEIR
ncbi:dienelactone hydrolase [Halanaerobium saccharolyticum]|uniref:Dienelactone hydrolase n=1 Tax=Halanaerobium saccharolyticum TaxID=43595 RepID=A0A4R7YW64_9FIRM|nr:alpha/beta hydrolase family protein [Halanaerobium saccharolyticum]RAK06877.1 dienelactone hydrolase [Halanaerobium saccharolyticum]TDW01487.1 dienelactone hydrolase [Halanaerobium saccharolyticum]TDX52848.1 dienelactone hydrolase [Halanaerobium saccharolyticum]